jgi:uncharacterized protein with NAD-binding domain and iron-sulfur cluster
VSVATGDERGKVIVLGGGCGALSAVFEITNQPDWQKRFDGITVYQLGWRLGGKGASGRGPHGRIEEHGLHIWLGFYDNAFRVMRQAYGELGRAPGTPLATWQDAFKKHSYIVVEDFAAPPEDRWLNWTFDFPEDDATPGSDDVPTPIGFLHDQGLAGDEVLPGAGGELPSLWDYVKLTLSWMVYHVRNSGHATQPQPPETGGSVLHRLSDRVLRVLHEAEVDLDAAGLAASAELLETAHGLAHKLSGDPTDHSAEQHHTLMHLLDKFIEWLWKELEHVIAEDDAARHLFILMDLGAATARGLLRDGVLYHEAGLDALDGDDFRAWLKKQGAQELSYDSAVVQALYDLVFAYHNGELDKPAFAAGVALRSIFRMGLTYRGAIFWKMQAGMGDTIFTPLYQVLKQRGVDFKFFHRVQSLGLSADKSRVDRITIGRQVTVAGDAYQPLVDVQGLACWPSRPDYGQIVEREQTIDGRTIKIEDVNLESFWTPWQDAEELTVEVGPDDVVILGISLGSLPYICPELIAASAAWRNMVDNVETARTMAVQLWLHPDLKALGWEDPSPVMDAYAEPLNTWADMSHLLPRENWPADAEPKNIAYYCGPMAGGIPPLEDREAPRKAAHEVKGVGRQWLDRHVRHLWPRATAAGDPAGLDWDLLVDPGGGEGEARYDAQFWRANLDPSERYVLSVPRTTQFRLKPGESGFANLYLAGDWTLNGFNAGCVEAAVMSGMQAAEAILAHE